MLRVDYRKNGIRLAHFYFCDTYDFNKLKNCDVAFVHGVTANNIVGGVLYTEQHTLLKDLSIPEEELFLSLGKHLRQYIKRSQRENKVDIRFYEASFIGDDLLMECKNIYEKMFSDKGMSSVFNLALAKQYRDKNALLIGAVYESEHLVGFDAVIHDEKNARLWLAAFDFRNEEEDSQVLSRAHQQLDWELLLKCKSVGITAFDFGGVNSFTEPNGIAQFKMNFEHENLVTYQNYLVPNGIIGKISLKIFLNRR